jgi:hypothetical protein
MIGRREIRHRSVTDPSQGCDGSQPDGGKQVRWQSREREIRHNPSQIRHKGFVTDLGGVSIGIIRSSLSHSLIRHNVTGTRAHTRKRAHARGVTDFLVTDLWAVLSAWPVSPSWRSDSIVASSPRRLTERSQPNEALRSMPVLPCPPASPLGRRDGLCARRRLRRSANAVATRRCVTIWIALPSSPTWPMTSGAVSSSGVTRRALRDAPRRPTLRRRDRCELSIARRRDATRGHTVAQGGCQSGRRPGAIPPMRRYLEGGAGRSVVWEPPQYTADFLLVVRVRLVVAWVTVERSG